MKPRRIWNLGRRDLLLGLSGGALSLLAPFRDDLVARAQSGAPTRFCALFQPNGIIESDWTPSGSRTSFDLNGTVLEPLSGYRDDLIIMAGLDLRCAREAGNNGSRHQQGTGCLLTGQPLLPGTFAGCGGSCNGGWADGISVDQHMANGIGSESRFASLELGVQVAGSDNRARISYAGPNLPVPPDDDPARAFDRVFAGFGGTDPEPSGAAELRRRRSVSVLDAVTSELTDIRGRVGREHYERVEAHLEAVRLMERRLSQVATTPACELPVLSETGEDYRLESRAQLDLIAAAFACNLTRVATLMWSQGGSYRNFPWLGVDRGWHDLGHDGSGSAREQISSIHRWFSGEVEYFLGRLSELGILDDTIVLWVNELNDGEEHVIDDSKIVIGGGGNVLETGQYFSDMGDRSHNCLLVSMLNAMGMDDTTFGHAAHQTGNISEILRPDLAG